MTSVAEGVLVGGRADLGTSGAEGLVGGGGAGGAVKRSEAAAAVLLVIRFVGTGTGTTVVLSSTTAGRAERIREDRTGSG
jgi:hypothetical protein